MKHTLRSFCCVIALLFLCAGPLRAQTVATWTGVTDPDWNNGANWDTDPLAPNTSSDQAIFGNGTPTAVSISAPTSADSIIFQTGGDAFTFTVTDQLNIGSGITNNSGVTQTFHVTGSSGLLTITGGSLADVVVTATNGSEMRFASSGSAGSANVTVDNGGAVTFNDGSDAGTATFTANSGGLIVLESDFVTSGSATFVAKAGGTIDLSLLSHPDHALGSIAGAGTFNFGSLAVSVGGTNASTEVSGVIADGGLFSASTGASLVKEGTGTLTLSGENTYTGGTTINVGTLQIGNGGTTGSVLGDITDNATLAFNRSDAFEFSGVISGSGSLQQLGTGTLMLSGANTYTGETRIVAGTLALGNSFALSGSTLNYLTTDNGVLDFSTQTDATFGGLAGDKDLVLANGASAPVALTIGNTTGTAFYSGNLSGAGSLTKNGTGVQILAGTNSYTGGTTVAGGTLQFAQTLSLPDMSTLMVGSYATAAFNIGGAGEFDEAGIGTVLGTAYFQAFANLGLDTTSGDFTYSSALTDTGNGPLGLVKLGANTLTLTSLNTYTGGTTVNEGTLLAGNATAFVGGTDYTVNGGTLDLGGYNLTMSSLSGAGGTVDLGSAALAVAQGIDTGFAGSFAGSGSFTKDGSGTLTLTGTNTGYAGTMTVANGTLQFGQVLALPNLANLTVAGGATVAFNVGGTGEFNQGNLDAIIPALNFLDSATLGLDTTNASGSFVYGGVITDTAGAPLGLTKLGAGTLELTANSTYTGDTNINGGTLRLSGGLYDYGHTVRPGGSAIYVNNGSTLVFGNNNVFDVHDQVPQVAITVNAGGLVTNDGDYFNTLNNLTLNGGELRAVGGAAPDSFPAWQLKGTVTVGGSTPSLISVVSAEVPAQTAIQIGDNTDGGHTTFQVADVTGDGSPSLTIQNVLVDGHNTNAIDGSATVASGLTKTGAGTLALLADNTYTGGTTVSAGTLQLGIGGTAGSVIGNITVNDSGVVAFNRSDTYTYAGNIDGSGSVTQAGNTVVLSGTNTYTGTTTVASGTLQFAQTLSLASAANLTVNSGTTATFNVGGTGEFDEAAITNVLNSATFQVGSTLGFDTSNADLGHFNYGGVIADPVGSGFLGLVKSGANTLTLTGANTYSGNTTVTGGTLALSDAGTFGDGSGLLTVTGGSTVDLGGTTTAVYGVSLTTGNTITNGALTASGTYNLNGGSVDAALGGTANLSKSTTDTTTLSGANTYTGATGIYAGTLAVTGGGMLGTGDLSVNSGATLDLTGAAAAMNVGALSGNGTINLDSTALTTTSANDAFFSGTLTGTGGSLTKAGAGTLALNSTNTYTGGTTISAGTILFENTAALPATGALSVGAGATAMFIVGGGGEFAEADLTGLLAGNGFAAGANLGVYVPTHASFTYATPLTDTASGALGLVVAGAGTLSLSGPNTYSGGTTIAGGNLSLSADNQLGAASGGLTFNGGTLISTADVTTARAIAFNGGGTFQPAADTTLTLNGAISGTGDLVMNDVGTLVLAAANTYTGNTVVNAGTLALTGAGTLGDGTGDLVVRAGTTVDLGGTSQSVADLDLHTAQLLGGSGSTLTVAQGHGFYVGSGDIHVVLAGGASLLKQDDNSLGLWEANTFTGTTTIGGGSTSSIRLENSLALQNSTLLYGNSGGFGGYVSFQGLTAATFGGVSGDKDLALVNNSSAGVALTVGGNNSSTTYSGSLSGAGGSLTKTGTGTLTLSGANTYDGGTTVSQGTLQFVYSGSLAPGGLVVGAGASAAFSVGAGEFADTDLTAALSATSFAAGSFLGLDTTNGDFTYGGLISGAPNLVKMGGGLLTLTGTNTYSGGTTVTGGLVNFNSAANFGSGLITLNGGGLQWADLTTTDISGSLNGLGSNGAIFDTNGNDVTFASVVSGNGPLIKLGAGTLTLTAVNTYTSGSATSVAGGSPLGTVVNAGTLAITAGGAIGSANHDTDIVVGQNYGDIGALQVDGAGSMVQASALILGEGFNSAGTATVSNGGSVEAPGLLVGFDGSGTLNLTGGTVTTLGTGSAVLGINNDGTGTMTVSGGTLDAGTGIVLGIGGQGTLTVSGTGAVTADIVTLGAFDGSSGTLNLNGGMLTTGQVIKGDGAYGVASTGTITFDGGTLQASAGSANFLAGFNDGDGVTTGDVQIAGGGAFIDSNSFDIGISTSLQGAGGLTKLGAGTLTLSGANTYTGGTTVSAGTLSFTTASALAGFDNTTRFASLTDDKFNVGSGATVVLSVGSGEFVEDDITKLLALNAVHGTGGFLGGSRLGLNTTADFTYNGTIADPTTGTLGLTKSGDYALTLSGTNTYSGGTTVSAGTLIGQGISAFGSGTITLADANVGAFFDRDSVSGQIVTNNFVVSSGTGTAAIGTSLAVPSDYSFVDFTGTLNLNRPTTLVDAGSDPSGRTSFDGVISGNVGTLTIAGSRVTLSAANTFTGNVDITGGALLQINGNGTTQVLPLAANVQLTQGTLSLVGDAAIGSLSGAASSTVEVSPLVSIAATLTTGANNASTTFAGQLLDGGDTLSLTKVGTGTLTLSGANTYSGRTTVAQGTLALGMNNALPTGGTLTLAGGTFALGGHSQTLGSLTLSAISTIDFGSAATANALAFSDSHLLSWSGTLTVLNYNSATDSLRFGTDATGLTAGQLSRINFNGYTALMDGSGFLTASAIPEPSTYAAILGLGALGFVAWKRRRGTA